MTPKVTVERLARWLSMHGLGEDLPGYGHATCTEIATEMVEAWDIRFNRPVAP